MGYDQTVKNKFFGISKINVLYVLNYFKNELQYNLLSVTAYFCLFHLFSNNHVFYLFDPNGPLFLYFDILL